MNMDYDIKIIDCYFEAKAYQYLIDEYTKKLDKKSQLNDFEYKFFSEELIKYSKRLKYNIFNIKNYKCNCDICDNEYNKIINYDCKKDI